MRILLLTHGFNSLTQRLLVELNELGHDVSIELDIADSVAEEAVGLFQPELILAPFLRRRIPESLWSRHVCLVVHPGIVGDRGPSALDWAIQEGTRAWGVTLLQANAVLDGGDIWATESFPMPGASGPPPKKSSVYRNEVTDAAVRVVARGLEAFTAGRRGGRPLDYADPSVLGRPRPPMTQKDRAIDWTHDDTATVLRKIAAADGVPGVADVLLGRACFLYDARAEPGASGRAGEVLGRSQSSILRATRDGAVWIGHVRRPDAAHPFKLPATLAFATEGSELPAVDADHIDPIRYDERDGVGYLRFELYNGAMATADCERIRDAWERARRRPTRVLVLMGGDDFWSNGIHLNTIEAADSPADESWRNILAMDDLARAVLETTDKVTVAALHGNAGAGGVFLALAADEVWARRAVVLNPHYRNMGNLYGSEYWTYSLPKRVGARRAQEIMDRRLPLGAPEALREGLVDQCFGEGLEAFRREVRVRAAAIGASDDYGARLARKQQQRRRDEAARPLAAYRDEELAEMHRNFYGFDPSYHYARHHFVHKVPVAWTPRHLARHRVCEAVTGEEGVDLRAESRHR